MDDLVDLEDLFNGADEEDVPMHVQVTHGGEWWGVSPCPYGLMKGADGKLVCRQRKRSLDYNPSIGYVRMGTPAGRIP